MRTSALVRVSTVVAGLLGISLISAGGATAAEPAPPVAVADTVTLWPGQTTQIDLLANDSSPAGDDLALCRFPEIDLFHDETLPDVVVSQYFADFAADKAPGPGNVIVASRPRARGTHTTSYYVCDHTHLVPATLTVVLRDVQPVDVSKVSGKRGLLKVTNHNAAPIRFRFGYRALSKPDDVVRIEAGATRTVRVQRHVIRWVALIGQGSLDGDLFVTPGLAGRGVVKHIKLKGEPLPKPKGVDSATSELVPGRWGA